MKIFIFYLNFCGAIEENGICYANCEGADGVCNQFNMEIAEQSLFRKGRCVLALRTCLFVVA